MALLQPILKQNILNAMNKIKASKESDVTSPLLSSVDAQAYADAYHSYAASAMAGIATIVVPGQASALKGPLMGMPLFTGWGPGLVAYWTPVMFTGPGYIPVNPTIAVGAIGASAEIALLLPPNKIDIKTEEEFAGKLATILDKWTKNVIVLLTTISVPPITMPSNLS